MNKNKILVLFFFGYILVVMALMAIFSYFFSVNFSKYALETMQNEAVENAVAIASTIDFSGHENIKTEEDRNIFEFQRIYDELLFASQIQSNIEYVYTMRPNENGDWEFVIDASEEIDTNKNGIIDDDERVAKIGEVYDISDCPAIADALHGPSVDSEITTDDWGSWISGYAPIYNSYGEIVGIVGTDISADELITAKKLIMSSILLTLISSFVVILILGAIGFVFFLRESNKIEEQLKIKNSELERLVAERTKSLEQFTAVVVHDLKSPLTSLKYIIEIQKDANRLTKSLKQTLDEMESITNGSITLVNSILESSKEHLKDSNLKLENTSINDIIKQEVKNQLPEAKLKNIQINTDLKDTPNALLDKAQIQRVIQNLLSNAIKYTDSGSITIKSSTTKIKKMIKVEIIDTGVGISKKDTSKLFKPFERIENGKPGTGLGLVSVKSIIEKHAGKIGVQSAPGKGSNFWFEIPTK
ncbi:HAMP domain-containing histidine kinase [Patescibacteria group bacterium]|nr:HAMP domain-containing histidine kinase [Patescibacteria group bacterium]